MSYSRLRNYFSKLYVNGSEEFHKMIEEAIQKEEKKFIVTANPETFMIGKTNEEFNEILNSREVTIVPDGIGVVKAARYLGIPVKERVTGVELSKAILEYANKYQKSLFLFGAKENVLSTLVEKIHLDYPDVSIVGNYDGYIQDKDKIMQIMVEKEPDIVLVALGIPQQEVLISKYFDRVNKGIFVGVGGTFDVLSGTKKRAPKLFIKLNLEWLYRIASEPKRIKRFVKSNVIFIFEVFKMRRK